MRACCRHRGHGGRGGPGHHVVRGLDQVAHRRLGGSSRSGRTAGTQRVRSGRIAGTQRAHSGHAASSQRAQSGRRAGTQRAHGGCAAGIKRASTVRAVRDQRSCQGGSAHSGHTASAQWAQSEHLQSELSSTSAPPCPLFCYGGTLRILWRASDGLVPPTASDGLVPR
jgi:hypothetical protein